MIPCDILIPKLDLKGGLFGGRVAAWLGSREPGGKQCPLAALGPKQQVLVRSIHAHDGSLELDES